ncbi:macrophage mannose receptor 1-like isoform X3 [Xiphophorus couchianus]|uniref:macrophage mannose receptor 1-like isoform X3 n=1 Tax=Xiphophorus couchianus TaxID=32473 RepID=UPI0010164D96|nr:macrophage mannose receptor 1-like isoform X3 [Xiphophorus couchianus]
MQWSLILLFLMAQCCFIDCQLYQFHYINENKNWTEAQQYCREKHTDLATVTNMKDMKRLNNISAGDQSEAWIGLYDPTNGTRTWFWSLPGVEFNESETNWEKGEPWDDWNSNCGILWPDAKWSIVHCRYPALFLCYDDMNTTHKYHLIEERKTWLEAQSYCREKHTDLISGTKQLQEAENMMNASGFIDYWRKPIYIGLFSNTWRWSDGSGFSFEPWYLQFDYQPNRGQCAVTVFDDEGRWRNENCTERKPFICYSDDKVILIKENKTWNEALTYCRGHHHDLVTVPNMDQQKQVEEKAKNASTPFVWIGLRFSCRLNVWFWVCDNWAWDEQNDCNMFGSMEAGGEYQWFQRNGSERFNFICADK